MDTTLDTKLSQVFANPFMAPRTSHIWYPGITMTASASDVEMADPRSLQPRGSRLIDMVIVSTGQIRHLDATPLE